MSTDSAAFIRALESEDLAAVRQIPKADLHNHFVLGGARDYLEEQTGRAVRPISAPLRSMREMDDWNAENLGGAFDTPVMRRMLIQAAFAQAAKDHIAVLEIGEDVWGLGEYFHGDVDQLVQAFTDARDRLAPQVQLRLQIGLSRHCSVEALMNWLTPFWGRKEFYSIDLYGDELAQPIENFIPIYRKAKENGLRLKAHVGEWGTAEDVVRAVDILGLDEVQHGIAAADSDDAMAFLARNNIRLNVTPTSNLLLGRVKDMRDHPIGRLYRAGVEVTVNSDDILIFDSEVSREYLSLYSSGVLTAQELDEIRLCGLRSV